MENHRGTGPSLVAVTLMTLSPTMLVGGDITTQKQLLLLKVTLNFSSLAMLSNNVKLTLNGRPINLANFSIQKSDVTTVENFLRGESLEDRLYVFSKLAAIEKKIAVANNLTLDSFAMEYMEDEGDDIILYPDDVDEMDLRIKEEPELIYLNFLSRVINHIARVSTSLKTLLERSSNLNLKTRFKRNISSMPSDKWPGTIHYTVSPEYDPYPNQKRAIAAAIRDWELETCLKFVKVDFHTGPHLKFKRRKGCSSAIGRKLKNGQNIYLGSKCRKKGLVIHEIGHAIGFWHEHCRPDRSQYVSIMKHNVKQGKLHNFHQRSWKDVITFNVPYDYSSIMHYGAYSFSSNGKKVIRAKEADMDSTLGNRMGLSFYDVKLANYHYCSDKCSGGLTWSSCKNDGYRNPKNCNKCNCPDGWTGTYCTNVQHPVNANCGSKYLTSTSTWKTLSSPNYDTSGLTANSQCTWRIQARKHYIINIVVEKAKCQEFLFSFKKTSTNSPLYMKVQSSSKPPYPCTVNWQANHNSRS